MLGKINIERFFSYVLMTILFLMTVDFIHKNIPRVTFKNRLPSCYFREVKLVFNNHFDNVTLGSLSIYRKLGRIYIRNCNNSVFLKFETNCKNFYLLDNESEDKVVNKTFYSYASLGDCDYLVFNCTGIFWVYIVEKNKSACVGGLCEESCPGIPIETEYKSIEGSIWEVGYS